jgi:hypothetical protein
MRRRANAAPLPFPDDDSDESLYASSDYFWMLRDGVIEDHTRAGWRSFRDGFATMEAFYRIEEAESLNAPAPPPQQREPNTARNVGAAFLGRKAQADRPGGCPYRHF